MKCWYISLASLVENQQNTGHSLVRHRVFEKGINDARDIEDDEYDDDNNNEIDK